MKEHGAKATFNDDAAMATIGRAVVAWAYVEFHIDALIALIHGPLGGLAIRKKAAQPLDARLEYLQHVYERLPVLANTKAAALTLIGEIRATADERHQLVHGVLTGKVPGLDDVIRTIRYKGILAEVRVEDFDRDRFERFQASTLDYRRRLAALAGEAIKEGKLMP